MSLNSESFGKLLESSKLLSPIATQQLFMQLTRAPASEPKSLAQNLIEQKLISPYQAEILLAGQAGPFHFGNYTIYDRYSDGPLKGEFKARHAPTRHPVCLTFFEGKTSKDLDRWQKIEQRVGQLKAIDSPFLASVLDSVVLPNYRFVVSQLPDGVSLLERLPQKARLPWKDSCTLLSQVAHALESLHKHGIGGTALSMEKIWVGKSGFTQFRPELKSLPAWDDSETESIPKDDWFQFGCCLFRLVTGKPFAGIEELKIVLAKLELPEELKALCSQLLLPNTESQISDRAVSKQLSSLAGKPLKSLLPGDPPSSAAFRRSIARFVPGSVTFIEEVPKLDTGNAESSLVEASHQIPIAIPAPGSTSKESVASVYSPRSRKKKLLPTIATLVGIWAFCGLLGIGAYYAANQKTPEFAGSNTIPTVKPDAIHETEGVPDSPPIASGKNDNPKSEVQPPILKQKLIEDDRAALWQSPTEGTALALDGLPPVPKILVAIRPHELLNDPNGKLLLRSLGGEFDQIVQGWKAQTGVPFSEVEQLVLSLHSNDEFRYESFVRCQLKSAIDANELIKLWGQPKRQTTTKGNVYYLDKGIARGFVVLDDGKILPDDQAEDSSRDSSALTSKESETISRFGFGSPTLVAEVTDSPLATSSTVMRSLAERCDQQRHLNLLFLRPAVFNDEGQALMSGKWSSLNRELAEILPDEIQGGSLSLHLDEGTFFEIQFAQTVDLKGVELMQKLQERFRDSRDRTTRYIAAIPPSPYWDGVRLRLSLMIVDFFRNLRWGVEDGEVIANCWLPPMAAHNLIAATELAINFSGGTATSATRSKDSAVAQPTSLNELLKRKRDLKIANPPDLNLLMSDLETEIKEEFPGLPFQFRIRLMGPDLQIEGITQNQRPSELNMQQMPLNEILTAIMVSANPAKDIAGASDPRCKLVWAIADDPDNPGQEFIAITTRAAAERKKYQLPPAFQIE